MSSGHILVTGLPGSGKTTLVRKVANLLQSKGLSVNGFVTEEIRGGAERTGFQVVSIPDGKTGHLATVEHSSETGGNVYVGKYQVCQKEFEAIAIPILNELAQSSGPKRVAVIDEIGKMETSSSRFSSQVLEIFDRSNLRILATIPVAKGRPLVVVEKLRCRPDVKIFTVTRNNRDTLVDEIVALMI